MDHDESISESAYLDGETMQAEAGSKIRFLKAFQVIGGTFCL